VLILIPTSQEWLIDHETACNAGNWQWLSCVAFYSQFYRCYSPIAFPAKWDKHAAFVRKYVPELRNYSDKYIYEPWKAPIADQKAWGCVIKGDGGYQDAMEGVEGSGGDRNRLTGLNIAMEGETLMNSDDSKIYPKPMFDFPTQREICINGLKQAYHVGLRGNSAKVLDGSWRELFDDDAEGPTNGVSGLPGAMIGLDGRGEAHTGDDALSGAVGVVGAGRKHRRDEADDTDDAESSPKARKSSIQSPRKSSVQSPRGTRTTAHTRKTRKGGQQQATLDTHLKKMS